MADRQMILRQQAPVLVGMVTLLQMELLQDPEELLQAADREEHSMHESR